MTHLIDLMIVGVEKAGTTSLLRYLGCHPDISTHEVMEFPFFVDNRLYDQGYEAIYSEYFPLAKKSQLVLAKNVGCIYWNDAPGRMKAHNPDMKLIAVLRDPVSRAYSAYWYARQMGREDAETFEKAISMEPSRLQSGNDYDLRYHAYLDRGLYFRQIDKIFKYFPSDQVQIVIFEEFKENPKQTLNRLFKFIDVCPKDVNTNHRHNKTSGEIRFLLKIINSVNPKIQIFFKKILSLQSRRKIKTFLSKRGAKKVGSIPPISAATRKKLQRYFESDIIKLEKMLGRELDMWRE